jgi:anti-sigma regulatory factor (Ser/Thr protein kinase)
VGLPEVDRLALAAVPACGPPGEPGGRGWCDAVAGDDDTVALALGDTGPASPGVAELLRRALVGHLHERRSPAEALERLDRDARAIPGSAGSTALCLALDTASGTLRWAAAGPLPPLLVGPEGARFLRGAEGAPLGRPDRPPFTHAEETLPAGSTVVLATAALFGNRSGEGPERIAAAAARCHELAPTELVAALLAQPVTGPPAADQAGSHLALLVARLVPAPLQMRLPADARRLAAMRRTVAAWSAQAALSDDTTADLQLLLSEAATNAVEHAYRDTDAGEFVCSVGRRGNGGVRVTVQDFGRWRPPPPNPGYRGRGLAVISTLAEEVALGHTDAGTRIAFTVPAEPASLPRPAEPTAGDRAEGSR